MSERKQRVKVAKAVKGGAVKYKFSSAETVVGSCLPIEGVDYVHGVDALHLGVLGVGDGVKDNVLKEDIEEAPGLLVGEARDPLDSAPPSLTRRWMEGSMIP